MIPGLATNPDDEQDPLALPVPGMAPLGVGEGGGAPTPTINVSAPAPVMQFPEHSEHKIGTQTTTKHRYAAPGTDALESEIADNTQRAAEAHQNVADAKAELAEKQAQEDERQAKIAMESQEKIRAAQAAQALREAERQRLVETRMAEAGQRQEELAAANQDLWATPASGEKSLRDVLGAFIVGLSTAAHVRAGGTGPGPAYQVLMDRQAQDRQRKLDRLTAAREGNNAAQKALGEAKAGVMDDAWYKREVERIHDEEAAQTKVATALVNAYAKRNGSQQAQAAADEFNANAAADASTKAVERRARYDVESSSESGRTDITDNTVTKTGPKGDEASITDVEKRSLLLEQEKNTRELQRIALNNPGAINTVKEVIRNYNLADQLAENPVGKSIRVGVEALGGKPASADEALKDSDPDARAAYSLIKNMISTKAKMRGGSITKSDQDTVTDELGFQGKSPHEVADAAASAAESAKRQRRSMEANKTFKDTAPDYDVATPEEIERTNRNRVVRATQELTGDREKTTVDQAKAIGDLARAARTTDEKALTEAADAAKAAGVPADRVDRFVRAWQLQRR